MGSLKSKAACVLRVSDMGLDGFRSLDPKP